MRMRGLLFLLLACAGTLAGPADASAAETWPSARPISWIVGFSPGGSVDVITRAVAQNVSASLKQSIVVENKPGGAGSIALSNAARSMPDGYTLTTMAGPILYGDTVPAIGKELSAVATLAKGAIVLVGPNNGPRDIRQLMDAIRAQPDRFAYASSGIGTGQHIAGEMFNFALKAKMVHVPYKGGSQAIADLLGGQVQLAFLGVSTVLEQIRNGKIVAYAVSTPQRVPQLPAVPTLKEAGLENFDVTQWYIVAAPAGLPGDVQARLKHAISQAVESPDIRALLDRNGLVAADANDADAAQLVRNSLETAHAVARAANLSFR